MSDDARARRTATLGIKSILVSDFFTSTLKTYGHRHRPNSGDSYNQWDGPALSFKNLSFPSGHSTAAFALATVVATEYRNKLFIAPIAYGMASLTALSRVHDNKHWASDIFLGSAIGFFTAKAILKLNRGYIDNISISPAMIDNSSGVSIRYKL